MPVKAKDIKGFLGEEETTNFQGHNSYCAGYNNCRQEIAQKELGLDKELLLQQLGLVYTYPSHEKKTMDSTLMIDIAQALIDNEHQLIVVKDEH